MFVGVGARAMSVDDGGRKDTYLHDVNMAMSSIHQEF